MSGNRYYLALQYSAIQKTVLRHDRLWSISGMSQILAKINEVDLYKITKQNDGTVVVAGGGKFTAVYPTKVAAGKARKEIIAHISEKLPMLEIQVSDIVEAPDLKTAKSDYHIIDRINNMKYHFRGYAVTHNPHLELCSECGEYPAIRSDESEKTRGALCAVCRLAKENCLSYMGKSKNAYNKGSEKDLPQETTLAKIYREYFSGVYGEDDWPRIPLDFNDLSSHRNKPDQENAGEEKKRMAVWFSDLNNMNDKVPIWFDQKDEDIIETFRAVKEVNINIIVNALCRTFKKSNKRIEYIPFRVIVAGGDDLRIVMDEPFILDFVVNLSESLHEKINNLGEDHPLHVKWLEQHKKIEKVIKPYSFGGSFIVTAIHAPFRKIHDLCEDLMSHAKEKTNRYDNSVAWRILSEGEKESPGPLKAENPLFIDKAIPDDVSLRSFSDYLSLAEKHRSISATHRYQIIDKIAHVPKTELEKTFIRMAAKGTDKDFTAILSEPKFRNAEKKLLTERIVTLFELMGIAQNNREKK